MLPRFNLGDTLSLTKTLTDYPATSGWVLHYRLLSCQPGGPVIAFHSTASGCNHVITVAAATTAAWNAGDYRWASWVTDGTSTHSIEDGSVNLLQNPRTFTAAVDRRTDTQIALDNVRATIRGKATADVLRYEIAGRTLERYPMRDLIALESRLAAQVANEHRAEQLAQGRPDPRRFAVRLGRA